MSSATSIDRPEGPSRIPSSPAAPDPATASQAIEPWQFFLLLGMLAATGVVFAATGQSAASIIVLSLTVVAASTVAMGAYRSLVPLVRPDSVAQSTGVGSRTRIALEREKLLALRAIKELEFDHAMGKIAPADFDDLSSRLRSRAIGLMRQIDAAAGTKGLIEDELQRRLSALPAPSGPPAPAAAPGAGRVPLCESCGGANDADARFCKQCGHRLAADANDAHA